MGKALSPEAGILGVRKALLTSSSRTLSECGHVLEDFVETQFSPNAAPPPCSIVGIPEQTLWSRGSGPWPAGPGPPRPVAAATQHVWLVKFKFKLVKDLNNLNPALRWAPATVHMSTATCGRWLPSGSPRPVG